MTVIGPRTVGAGRSVVVSGDRTPGGASRAGLLVALTLVALPLHAPPVAAHTALEQSDPSSGQQLAAAPERVRLVFTGAVDERLARVALSSAGGSPVELPVSVDDVVLVAQVPRGSSGASGAWRIDFRVVSADGHPVAGTVPFFVTAVAPPPAASGASLPPAAPSSAAAAPTDVTARPEAAVDDAGALPWAGAAGAVLLLGGGLLVLRHRRDQLRILQVRRPSDRGRAHPR